MGARRVCGRRDAFSAMRSYPCIAQVRLDGGTQCSAFVRKFPALLVDEPPDMGGNDAGMNPVELLLTSLGACQGIVYSLYERLRSISWRGPCKLAALRITLCFCVTHWQPNRHTGQRRN